MRIVITCPACRNAGTVRQEYVGRRVTCKRCGEVFAIVPRRRPLWARLARSRLVAAVMLVAALCVVLGALLATTRHQDTPKRKPASLATRVAAPPPGPKGPPTDLGDPASRPGEPNDKKRKE
jgi:hypothetical protein